MVTDSLPASNKHKRDNKRQHAVHKTINNVLYVALSFTIVLNIVLHSIC